MRETRDAFPVTVVTGFLGSGKTTVLNTLMQRPAMDRTLVLVNEFGEIGLDHDLVTQGGENATYVEMSSGCLCCSIRGDLVETLRYAPSRFARNGQCWFDRVVIETTGLADPAPILHTLMAEPSVARRFELQGVVTVIDAANGEATLEAHEESIKQAAVADTLLISKTDLADDAALESLRGRLASLNPLARRALARHGDVDPAAVLALGLYDPDTKSAQVQRWLQDQNAAIDLAHHAHDHHHHDVNRHSDDIRAFSIVRDAPIAVMVLETWLDILRGTLGEDLLRVKGILNVEGYARPVIVHGVQHILHPIDVLDEWPSEDHRTRLVFITRGIDPANIEAMLDAFTGAK